MKFKYLTSQGNFLWAKNHITKETLQMVKDGRYENLIDIENGTYFDSESNSWKEIEGDK